MRLGGGAQVAEAIRSCEQAIALLRTLPLAGDQRFPRRLAMAHHNRGLFLRSTAQAGDEVLAAFARARGCFSIPTPEHEDRQYTWQ